MKSFWTNVLKVVMVLSFIGALAFVGIAVITNQGIEFESYAYISRKITEANFADTQQKISDNVKLSFGMSSNKYTSFLVEANKEMNDGISLFLDYLSIERTLQKGEHNALISSYDSYLSKHQKVRSAYVNYKTTYDTIDSLSGDEKIYAQNLLKSQEFTLSSLYADCYKSGSAFFKILINTVKSHSFSGAPLPYSCQRYLIKLGLCDYVVKQVFTPSRDNIDINQNTLRVAFGKYLSTANGLSDDVAITNTNFLNFITTLNAINVYEWAGNFSSYVLTLSPSLAAKAQSAREFFNGGNF